MPDGSAPSHRVLMLTGAHPPGPSSSLFTPTGQSQAQQDKDKYQCSQWASQQTGFDPTVPPPIPQASAPPPPGMYGGAFRGAAFGAIGRRYSGNAGKALPSRGMGALCRRDSAEIATRRSRSTRRSANFGLSQSKGRLFPGPRRLPDRARLYVN